MRNKTIATTQNFLLTLLMLFGLTWSNNAFAEQMQSQTLQGFTASAALVSDSNWEEKWSASGSDNPEFDLAQSVTGDEHATLLIYFSNPKPMDSSIFVTCDVEIRDSRRALVGRLQPKSCFTRTPSAEAIDVYLFPSMELTASHATASGLMTLTVEVTDENRHQTISLTLDIMIEKS